MLSPQKMNSEGKATNCKIVPKSEFLDCRPKRLKTDFYCETCQIYTCSQESLESHFQGSKHQTTVKRLKDEKHFHHLIDFYPGIIDNSGSFYCEFCDCTCTSMANLRIHMAGRRHRESLKLREKEVAPQGSTWLEDRLKECFPVVGLDSITEYYGQEGVDRSFSCALCRKHCDKDSIVSHVMSAEHQLAYLKRFNGEEYDNLQKKRYSSTFLEIAARSWAEELEKTYGRGRPATVCSITINDSDDENASSSPLGTAQEVSAAKSSASTREKNDETEDLRVLEIEQPVVEKSCLQNTLEVLKKLKVTSSQQVTMLTDVLDHGIHQLMEYELKRTPTKLRKALAQSLLRTLKNDLNCRALAAVSTLKPSQADHPRENRNMQEKNLLPQLISHSSSISQKLPATQIRRKEKPNSESESREQINVGTGSPSPLQATSSVMMSDQVNNQSAALSNLTTQSMQMEANLQESYVHQLRSILSAAQSQNAAAIPPNHPLLPWLPHPCYCNPPPWPFYPTPQASMWRIG